MNVLYANTRNYLFCIHSNVRNCNDINVTPLYTKLCIYNEVLRRRDSRQGARGATRSWCSCVLPFSSIATPATFHSNKLDFLQFWCRILREKHAHGVLCASVQQQRRTYVPSQCQWWTAPEGLDSGCAPGEVDTIQAQCCVSWTFFRCRLHYTDIWR